jgi:methylenetetrahydrofolate dehydrogenase (NADP+) / methenyltetrahydrofolate cyclohydrolase
MIFDGKTLASEKTKQLKEKFQRLESHPLVVIFQVGDDLASKIFIDLKTKKAMELGVVVEHVKLPAGEDQLLEELCLARLLDDQVNGVMIQLPAVGIENKRIEQILAMISPKKDVDGLNPESGVLPAVVRAVETAYEEYVKSLGLPKNIAVVGAKGNLGKKFVNIFSKKAVVIGFDQGDDLSSLNEADLVILCTGVAGLVSSSLLKDKAGVIDLGASVGEFVSDSDKYEGFWTPVPGGIGPMTVVSLFENLFDLVSERSSVRI